MALRPRIAQRTPLDECSVRRDTSRGVGRCFRESAPRSAEEERSAMGLRFESSGLPAPVTGLAEVNRELSVVRSKVWPLDLRSAPAEIRRLLDRPTLETAETTHVMNHFLLPRERLLEIIGEAGRTPNVP